jgi:hypothetical protein
MQGHSKKLKEDEEFPYVNLDRKKLLEQYQTSPPYPHIVVQPFQR